jgi:hypothetical protein
VSAEEPGQADWKYIEANFVKPDGSTALIDYSVFDETGRAVEPPSYTIWSDIWRTLEKQYRLTRTEKLFQIQVFSTANGNPSDQQRATSRKLLLLARQQFREFISTVSPNRQLAGR